MYVRCSTNQSVVFYILINAPLYNTMPPHTTLKKGSIGPYDTTHDISFALCIECFKVDSWINSG